MIKLILVILMGVLIAMPVEGQDDVYGSMFDVDTNPPLIAQVPAITSAQHDWSELGSRTVARFAVPTMVARGCRGEYVPLTFLTLMGGMKWVGRTNFMVTAEPFHNDEFTFPEVQRTQGFEQPCTDVRWVKWWWQAGHVIHDNKHPVWTPELLLHDFDLVRSSWDVPNVNVLRDGDLPQDAMTLQPMTIPPRPGGYQQQVWMTIFIPLETPPGSYDGSVTVTSDQTPDLNVPIRLYVWPFELVPPRIDYSIYYRGKLVEATLEPKKYVSSEYRTMKQMKADYANMARHGVVNPVIYSSTDKAFCRVLGMRRSVGCDNRRIFSTASGVGYQVIANPEILLDPDRLRWVLRNVEDTSRSHVRYMRRYGVQEFGRYGKDEGKLEQIAKQVPLWRAATKGGAFVFTACNAEGFEDVIEDSLGVATISCPMGFPTPELIAKLHEQGTDVYVYGNPQCGNEDPLVYRLSQGLKMMASGVDGSMNYAWQSTFPANICGADAWDDFYFCDRGIWRAHMMTYPGVDTPVDTLQWEGYAAGIIDARYLTTLEAEIVAAPEDCELADEAQAFIDRVYSEVNTTDLEAMRLECAQFIVKLQETD